MADRAAILDKQTVYQGWMKILRVKARIESDEVEREVEHQGRAVAVLPYDAQRRLVLLARQVRVPIIGIGGIATIDDVMEFLVAGASAVQLGTVNFYDPTAAPRVVEQLPEALRQLGANSVRQVVGSIQEK